MMSTREETASGDPLPLLRLLAIAIDPARGG
jgi:hypothetical protein